MTKNVTFGGKLLDVVTMPIGNIRPYARNPRKNDSAVDAVAASLREFGWRNPIVVDENHVIICGHTRLKAAQKLGMVEVPVHVATDLSVEKVAALRLADNKSAELAEWDFEKLDLELADIELDMGAFGFTENNEAENISDQEIPVEKYSILIEFDSENDQKKIYDELAGRGLKCKILTT
jgi:ParB-like chromosome segregation protein Spo0J